MSITIVRCKNHQGSVVFGTIFEAYWDVYIRYAESIDGITQMMGSKYAQAIMLHISKGA